MSECPFSCNAPYLSFVDRRVLFVMSFFLFFYNIFIGLFSCLFRIIKSIVIGALFLSRLDNSALPRRFQMMDPGKKTCFPILINMLVLHYIIVVVELVMSELIGNITNVNSIASLLASVSIRGPVRIFMTYTSFSHSFITDIT